MPLSSNQAAALSSVPIKSPQDAPWRWLSEGAKVYAAHPVLSAGYGLLFVLIGYGLAGLLFTIHLVSVLPMAIACFALAGPIMAAGLYSVAQAHEKGRKGTAYDMLFPSAKSPTQIAYLGVIILVAVLFWIATAAALFAAFHATGLSSVPEFLAFSLTTPRGLTMIAVGTLVGAILAFGLFAVSAFSIPLLMDRELDFATAIAASVNVVRENTTIMLLWAWVIALCIGLGTASFFLGFVYLFPVLGYATWAAYRDMFPSSS
ncbi:MAG: DUF2189 domain-containing protein [Parvularculaceae bacterium]|nr:DUF2189 domain-containing protein [Parvularculaceae bacterium]